MLISQVLPNQKIITYVYLLSLKPYPVNFDHFHLKRFISLLTQCLGKFKV